MRHIFFIVFFVGYQIGFGQDTFQYSDTTFKIGAIHRIDLEYAYGHPPLYQDPNELIYDSIVSFLEKYPYITIEVHCHTDTRGNAEYNLKLSNRRAQLIVNELIKKGITPTRLAWAGYGETKPIYSEQEIEAVSSEQKEKMHAINHRCELKIATNFK